MLSDLRKPILIAVSYQATIKTFIAEQRLLIDSQFVSQKLELSRPRTQGSLTLNRFYLDLAECGP